LGSINRGDNRPESQIGGPRWRPVEWRWAAPAPAVRHHSGYRYV